jgi:hypothetical protein
MLVKKAVTHPWDYEEPCLKCGNHEHPNYKIFLRTCSNFSKSCTVIQASILIF